MIYRKKPPKVRLNQSQLYRAKVALMKQGKKYQSTHNVGGELIVLYYRVIEGGKKSHGQIKLDDLI